MLHSRSVRNEQSRNLDLANPCSVVVSWHANDLSNVPRYLVGPVGMAKFDARDWTSREW